MLPARKLIGYLSGGSKSVIVGISLLSILVVNDAVAQAQGSDAGLSGSPAILIVVLGLIVGYGIHGYLVWNRNEFLKKSATNRKGKTYSKFWSDSPLESEWALALFSIALPVGLAVITQALWNENLGSDSQNFALFMHQCIRALLVVLITLEISLFSRVQVSEWQRLLGAALVLDLLSFLLISVVGEPSSSRVFSTATIFGMALIGFGSLVSSYMTIVFARAFDTFALDVKHSEIDVSYQVQQQ